MPPDDRAPQIRRTSSIFAGASASSSVTRTSERSRVAAGMADVRRPFGDPGAAPRPDPAWLRRQHERLGTTEEAQEAADNRIRVSELARAATDQVYLNGHLFQEITILDPESGLPTKVWVQGGLMNEGESLLPHLEQEGMRGPSGVDRVIGLTAMQQQRMAEQRAAAQATFSVLAAPSLGDGTQQFVFSHGPRMRPLDAEGRETAPSTQDLRVGGRNATQTTAAERPQVTNMMTLDAGIQWFRKLSNADPETYDTIIEMLIDGDYLPESVVKGMYTREAGRGFGEALADLAENNSAGNTDDLMTFLEKISTAGRAAREEAKRRAFEPIRREYTDPAQLMATARAAAEDLLGRGLTEEEAARFAGRFRGLEDAVFDQIDAAGQSGGTARVVIPNASGQAEAFARSEEFRDDRARQLAGGFMDSFQQLIFGR